MSNAAPAGPDKREHRPDARYVRILWLSMAFIQMGFLSIWATGWMGPGFADPGSVRIWLLFDLLLVAGCLHATLFRVRTDSDGIEFLTWYFGDRRWGWDEVTRVEQRRIAFLGHHAVRYRVSAGREHLSVASFAVEDVDQLAETVVYCADLDDLGEREIQMQQGMVHLWVHPSADDEEW